MCVTHHMCVTCVTLICVSHMISGSHVTYLNESCHTCMNETHDPCPRLHPCIYICSVSACCSVLQCVAVRSRVLQSVAECCRVLQSVAECCLQSVACSVSQCVEVYCSVMQCDAV